MSEQNESEDATKVKDAASAADENQPSKKHVKPKVLIGAAAAVVIIVFGVLFGTHVLCIHNWQEATCTEPRTCSICGRTEGDSLGHVWEDATCTDPQTCSRCGETQGAALGHDWQEATCTEPKTCKRCGTTEGAALGHQVDSWNVTKEASCTEAGSQEGTCTRCGETLTQEIPMVDHVPGDWEVEEDYTITSSGSVLPGKQVKKCTVCGKVLNEQKYTVDLTTSQRNALATAASYLKTNMAFSYSGLVDQLEFEGFPTEDATFAVDHCGADWMEQAEKSAKSYLDFMSFSRSGLINQLEFEGFTPEQFARFPRVIHQ